MPPPSRPSDATSPAPRSATVRHDLRGALTTIHAAATTLRTQRDQLGPERVDHICALLEDRSRGAVRLLAELDGIDRADAAGDDRPASTYPQGLSPDG